MKSTDQQRLVVATARRHRADAKLSADDLTQAVMIATRRGPQFRTLTIGITESDIFLPRTSVSSGSECPQMISEQKHLATDREFIMGYRGLRK